jgi:phosphatidylglycerol:prolipoprotein diacylglycerol transferase
MNVYPLILQLGPIQITGYGVMMMVGFLVGGWSIQINLKQLGYNEDYAADLVVAAVIGGVVGAKLWYVVLTQDPAALFSRGGLVWYGGFVGGTLAVMFQGWRLRVPTRLTAEVVAPSLALGYALGRVGCFMVQDDYGVPTSLPWGLRFPEGAPASTAQNLVAQFGVEIPAGTNPLEVLAVHPTQLYEATLMMLAFYFLWKMRSHGHGTGWLMGLYVALAGSERFLIEFLRAKDDRLLGAFTVAQATSLLLVATGVYLMVHFSKKVDFKIPSGAGILVGKTT